MSDSTNARHWTRRDLTATPHVALHAPHDDTMKLWQPTERHGNTLYIPNHRRNVPSNTRSAVELIGGARREFVRMRLKTWTHKWSVTWHLAYSHKPSHWNAQSSISYISTARWSCSDNKIIAHTLFSYWLPLTDNHLSTNIDSVLFIIYTSVVLQSCRTQNGFRMTVSIM